MPDHTIRVPDLPWLQSFAPGDRVRVITDAPYGGRCGNVKQHPTHSQFVLVELWDGTEVLYRPGELRPL